MLLFKLKSDRIGFRISEVREALDHAHNKQDRGVYPDRDAGIALFNLDQRRPAYGSALRRNGHRDAPPPASIAHIVAQLA